MMLEEGMQTYLLAQPTLAALVKDRIYGLIRAQGAALPEVRVQRITSTRQVLFCGTNALVDAQVQVDAYAMSGQDVWAVAKALRKILVDFVGTMGATYIDQCTLTNEFPLVDPDPGIIRVTQLYNVWYLED